MRFDDRLTTILQLSADNQKAKAAIWSQLVLLVAQNAGGFPDDQEASARAKIKKLHHEVPVDRRKFMASALAGHISDIETLLIFATDSAPVASVILKDIELSDTGWGALIPKLPSTSRTLLRERRDLPLPISHMLKSYGSSDNALPPANLGEVDEAEDGSPIQIRDLVARIEAFKNQREAGVAEKGVIETQYQDKALSFRFEVDRTGIISWVQGAPRGALIGISFTEASEPRAFGVDGHAAGAFRKRSPFKSARLRVAGSGAASGDWLISADPHFDANDGRFCGYRGIARRAEPGEHISPSITAPFGKDMTADSIRQLVHELRSPINAIRGFAEMVDAQLLGPVSNNYRCQARQIVEDSIKLVNIVDDIDLTARLVMQPGAVTTSDATEVIEMVETALHLLDPQVGHHRINLVLSTMASLPLCKIDRQSGIRLIERMIATIIGITQIGETLNINVTHDLHSITIAIDQPCANNFDIGSDLSGLPPEQQGLVINPHPLGLNFSMRLIRQMAESVGIQFKIEAGKFALIIPQAQDSEEKTTGSG